ncbi:MAG: fibronectin type III domain-containing protein, partial [Verrucomicrobiota bacterium]
MIQLFSKKGLLIVAALCGLTFRGISADVRDYAIELTASIQKNPAQITLQWHAADDGAGYTVARKKKEGSTWDPLATLDANTKTFVDKNVKVGEAYEYRVLKNPLPDFGGSGFIYAGIDLPATENRGKLVLIVDNTYANELTSELARLQQDLVGDGWTVLRHDVSRN